MALPHRILPLLRQCCSRPLYRRPAPQLRCLATAPPGGKHTGEEPFKDLGPKDSSTPPRLTRPLGLAHPPRPGENSGIDTRTWAERREDFGDYDKHLAKRADLSRQFQKSYFADFAQISPRYKGKSFLAPPRLFKASKALFFPNLVGRTLALSGRQDTTPVLAGKVSLVAVFSTAWAEAQCRSFTEGLPGEGEEEGAGVQRVDINVEMNWLKAVLVRLFMPSIRRRLPVERHGRYFIVEKGLEEGVRGEMGFWNGRVGYVYLVDWECRIRWAGSGGAEGEEKEALRRGVVRLGEEWKRMEAERKEGEKEEKEEKKEKEDDEDW